MNYYSQEPSPEASRLTISSVVLLTIFIAAVVFIVYAGLTRPWADDDDATVSLPADPALQEAAADPTLAGDEVALQPGE